MDVVGQELEVSGPLGPRRYDIVTRNPDGTLHGLEIKSGGGTSNAYQNFTDMFINRFGATGRGQISGQQLTGTSKVYAVRRALMKLEVEAQSPVDNVAESTVRLAVAKLRSYGPSSFASLTDESGNYLQVAGGGVTCMIERRDASNGRHYRAFQDKQSAVFADNTALVFSGGEVKLASNEWFTSQDVEDVFLAFLRGEQLPSRIKWRDITDLFR